MPYPNSPPSELVMLCILNNKDLLLNSRLSEGKKIISREHYLREVRKETVMNI